MQWAHPPRIVYCPGKSGQLVRKSGVKSTAFVQENLQGMLAILARD